MAKKESKLDFSIIEKMMDENPDDFFSPEETDRRMKETMRRCCGQPRQFDLETGQNYSEPKLSEEELKKRGYPCKMDWLNS